MSNVLGDEKREQVLALGRLGWSLRRIEEETGVRRETASLYLRAAGIVVRRPGGRPRTWPPKPATTNEVPTDFGAAAGGEDTAKPATTGEVPTDPGAESATETAARTGAAAPPAQLGACGAGPQPPAESKPATTKEVPTASEQPMSAQRSPSASACEPFRELIEEGLGRGRNAVAIWQDLVDIHGFSSRYDRVKRFVAKLRGTAPVDARVVIRTEPGEEAQVDYGDGPMVRHPATGKYRRTQLFVMTLGHSRKSVRLLRWKSSAQIWAELHEEAFRRLGGAARVIVLDNLKEGVIKPDIYDPELNPLYRDVLKHYGAVALPCRVRNPDRKGKVESGVGHAQKTPLRGLRFESLDEAQRYLDRWEERWADTRIHGTTKRQVMAMFAEEKPTLLPLPLEPFRYYRFGKRTVNLDGAVEIDAAYYGAPPGWIGKKLTVQWDGVHVRLMHPKTNKLLREHLRAPRGFHRFEKRDLPKRTPSSTEALLRRAHFAGPSVGTLCEHIHRTEGPAGIRRILGVLSLVKKHGAPVVEDAALAALEVGAPNYRFVRRYLERRPPVPLSLRQVDPLIRQLTLYRDLIEQKTGDQT